MDLLVVGMSHRTAPIMHREKAALIPATIVKLLDDVTGDAAQEAVVLSTCNRTEVYATADDTGALEEHLIGSLSVHTGIATDELAASGYVFRDQAAVTHLFRVASSLDSAVVGEAEIQGQVRNAWDLAAEHGCVGATLDQLFRQAVEVGKQVRSETGLGTGAGAASLPAVAIDTAADSGAPKEQSAVVIGAGRMAESAVMHLSRHGFQEVRVVNRTLATAQKLAGRVGGRAATLDALPSALRTADVVISASGAASPILDRRQVSLAMSGRPGRPLTILDLALPRNVDPDVGEIPDVTLHDASALEQRCKATLRTRRGEALKAEAYIPSAVQRFESWLAQRQAAPIIDALRTHAEELRRAELERTERQWEGLSACEHERLNVLTKRLVNKLLHEPTLQSRAAAESGDPEGHLASLLHLFELKAQDRNRVG